MQETQYKYLDKVDSPDDLKRLCPGELTQYCAELRRFIIAQLSSNPGHLGSSLGVVELTVALHYVLNTPDDKLVWDVGHQAYAHKIITGRRDRFCTNRKLGGLSGFPKMGESLYDAFGAGQSSTSISAAVGIAIASARRGEKREVVAVIGDGALTGGLAFEGLNNAGASNANLLVVLNDNRMSIDPNVGALKEYLLNITTSKRYNQAKHHTWTRLERFPKLRRTIQKMGNALKGGFLQQSNLFESLNFRYFGPVDGHNVEQLTRVLKDLKEIPGPKLLHVLTVKGKGYQPAEEHQRTWHAPGLFNPETGERLGHTRNGAPPRYQDVFGETLLELARRDERIVGITPAMPTGCSLSIMMEQMPERCFDVGIAEGHAVTYSAGLVGEDGATHHGVFDLAAMLPVPGLTIASPMDEVELRNLMFTAASGEGPFVIRYPRGNGVTRDWRRPMETLPLGRGRILREGKDLALLTIGPAGNDAAWAAEQAAGEGISVLHADLRFAKPLDEGLLHRIGREFRRVITVEDGVVNGGVGAAVLAFMNRHGYPCRITMLGVEDRFVAHGTVAQLKEMCGYDAPGILRAIREAGAERLTSPIDGRVTEQADTADGPDTDCAVYPFRNGLKSPGQERNETKQDKRYGVRFQGYRAKMAAPLGRAENLQGRSG